MTEWPGGFVETLSINQLNTLRDLFEFRIKRVNWDFDQIFVDSEGMLEFKLWDGTTIKDK